MAISWPMSEAGCHCGEDAGDASSHRKNYGLLFEQGMLSLAAEGSAKSERKEEAMAINWPMSEAGCHCGEDAGDAQQLELWTSLYGGVSVTSRSKPLAVQLCRELGLGFGDDSPAFAVATVGHACDLPVAWFRTPELARRGIENPRISMLSASASMCGKELPSSFSGTMQVNLMWDATILRMARMAEGSETPEYFAMLVARAHENGEGTWEDDRYFESDMAYYFSDAEIRTLFHFLRLPLGEYADACLRLCPSEEMRSVSRSILGGHERTDLLMGCFLSGSDEGFSKLVMPAFSLIYDEAVRQAEIAR